MSPPTMNVSSCSGACSCSALRVSTVYDAPPRAISRSETSTQSAPATATRHSSSRTSAPGSSGASLCGGTATGISTTRSRPSWSSASCTITRWPMWGGLNVPPRMPRSATRPRGAPSGTHVPVALDDVLERAELAQRDRPARVELLRRVADLGAHAELAAVGEPGGRVDVHARRVHALLERAGGRRVGSHDRLGVARAVLVDVLDRLLDGVDDLHREHEREELGVPVLVGGLPQRGGEVLAGGRVRAPVDAQLDALRLQRPQRTRQELGRGIDVDEQRLGGVADAGPLRLRVDRDAL